MFGNVLQIAMVIRCHVVSVEYLRATLRCRPFQIVSVSNKLSNFARSSSGDVKRNSQKGESIQLLKDRGHLPATIASLMSVEQEDEHSDHSSSSEGSSSSSSSHARSAPPPRTLSGNRPRFENRYNLQHVSSYFVHKQWIWQIENGHLQTEIARCILKRYGGECCAYFEGHGAGTPKDITL